MAHDINKMIYVGVEPWHGLGTRLPQNASYEEIVEAAGFFTVKEMPVYVPGGTEPVADAKAIVLADTGRHLATVGTRYEIVQASDVARTLVEAASDVEAIFHTAGTLGASGARFWLLGELPGAIRVRGDSSPIKKYILGTSAHDGSSPVLIQNVATRVVCANTLGAALGEKTQARWSIKHTRSAQERLSEAARGFRAIVEGYERFGQLANVMASTGFTDRQMKSTVDSVMPVPQDDSDHDRLEASRTNVIRLFQEGRGMNGIRGTAWGAFQAWTEHADHHRATRNAGGDPARRRLESIWLGGAAELKRRALSAIAHESGIPLAA